MQNKKTEIREESDFSFLVTGYTEEIINDYLGETSIGDKKTRSCFSLYPPTLAFM